MDMEAKVVVRHQSLYIRGAVSFQLKIDGRNVGEVAGYEREYAVDPGSHFAEVRFVFVRTNQVNFNIERGGEVRLVCSPNYWIALLPLFIMLIFLILSLIPFSPTAMLYIGGALMILLPVFVIVIVLKPGMLVKLGIEK